MRACRGKNLVRLGQDLPYLTSSNKRLNIGTKHESTLISMKILFLCRLFFTERDPSAGLTFGDDKTG